MPGFICLYNDRQYITVSLGSMFEQSLIDNQGHNRSDTPLSPDVMFRQLMSIKLKSLQCEQESDKKRQQKQIILHLISQYSNEIESIRDIISTEHTLLETKASMMRQLRVIRDQRLIQNQTLARQLQGLRLEPIEVRDREKCCQELYSVRDKNARLSIRVKQLEDYLNKLQTKNQFLETQNKISSLSTLRRSEQRRVYDQNWRDRINQTRDRQQDYMREMKFRIKEREERAIKNLELREIQIERRNRQRRQSLTNQCTSRWKV